MSRDEITVRAATRADLTPVADLAGELVRMHHGVDADRFFLPERVEEGYAWWFGRELDRDGAVILVAMREDRVVGYAYGTIEERDWNMLLDDHGAIHDVFVAPQARRFRVGRRLIEAMIGELERRGAPRVVLATMVSNEPAQALFRACGFRPTMLEMTRTSASPKPKAE